MKLVSSLTTLVIAVASLVRADPYTEDSSISVDESRQTFTGKEGQIRFNKEDNIKDKQALAHLEQINMMLSKLAKAHPKGMEIVKAAQNCSKSGNMTECMMSIVTEYGSGISEKAKKEISNMTEMADQAIQDVKECESSMTCRKNVVQHAGRPLFAYAISLIESLKKSYKNSSQDRKTIIELEKLVKQVKKELVDSKTLDEESLNDLNEQFDSLFVSVG